MHRSRDYAEWYWGTFRSWFDAGIRLHRHNRADGELPRGGGHTQPIRRLYQRCCRCGRSRVMGKFVEMYSFREAGQPNSWWYECLDCAHGPLTNW